ncbi:STAS/SEC14 domain-containing protein [Aliiroseovarius sp. 2305UL8-7]|uniref:STAS/SEC14 domain-containing protein n=1 Tax=Aliiroseovarius conchicola TaxID=3121637 RepID=UPI00352998D4
MYQILPQSSGNIMGIEVSGKLDTDQIGELTAKADAIVSEHGKIRFLVVTNSDIHPSFKAAGEDMKWVLTHMNKLDKLAIVMDSKLMAALVSVDAKFASLVGIGEKHFNTDELDAAWAWVEED